MNRKLCLMEDNTDQLPTCSGCTASVHEPYISCVDCPPRGSTRLCLCCFARGAEFASHQSNHAYEILKNDFPLLDKGWTADEDLRLLDAIQSCGMGNWADIATQLRTKNKRECERHYEASFINHTRHSLPEFPPNEVLYPPPPILYKLSDDPPRPIEGSVMSSEMAGYMPARGDFIYEHNNFVELDVVNVNLEQTNDEPMVADMQQLDKDLKLAVVDIYWHCLKERHRRKRIIRDNGLMNMPKVLALNKSQDRLLPNISGGMSVFMQLLPAEEYDMYLEALHYEAELKISISQLQESRENGIKKLRNINVYNKLKCLREAEGKQRHMLTDVLSQIKDESTCQNWLHRQAVMDTVAKGVPPVLPNAPRRAAPPLDIVSMPGYDRLSEEEKELCATVRLVPDAYLEFRSLLINEHQKHGYLRLAQARQLIKIDVNKTRKLYNYLLAQGLIKDKS